MRTNELAGETNKQQQMKGLQEYDWNTHCFREAKDNSILFSWTSVTMDWVPDMGSADARQMLCLVRALGNSWVWAFLFVWLFPFFFFLFHFLFPFKGQLWNWNSWELRCSYLQLCVYVFIKLSWAVPRRAAEVVLPGAKPGTVLLLWHCLQLLGWTVSISCGINLVGKGCFFFSFAVDIFKIIQVWDFWLYHFFCPLTLSLCNRPKWLLSYGQI